MVNTYLLMTPRFIIALFVLLVRTLYPTCALTVWWGTFYEKPIVEECDPYNDDAFRTKRVFIHPNEAYAWTVTVMAEICRCPEAQFKEEEGPP